MYVHEIKPGTDINIIAVMGDHKGEFTTQVLDASNNCLIAKVLYAKEMRINFNSKGLTCYIQGLNTEDNRYYEFSKVTITTVKAANGAYFYKITSLVPGKVINRRGAVRLFLGALGDLYLGSTSAPPISITIKDISLSGLAFITDAEVKLEVGKSVIVSFSDGWENVKFTINCTIIRTFEMDRGRILYGCTLNSESNALGKYINEKQRKNMAHRR